MMKIAPLFHIGSVLAQTAAPAPDASSGMIRQLLILGLMFGGFFFLVIAPQRKKQKELQKSIDSIQAGDEVLTAGGIYGEVTNRKDDRFVIRIADNTKVEVGKNFITGVVKKGA
ncbi:MAG TPA: preprotein translocase subunit YajC [Opitutaceae bacterium]